MKWLKHIQTNMHRTQNLYILYVLCVSHSLQLRHNATRNSTLFWIFIYFIEKMQSTFLEDFSHRIWLLLLLLLCDFLLTLHSRGSLPFKLVCYSLFFLLVYLWIETHEWIKYWSNEIWWKKKWGIQKRSKNGNLTKSFSKSIS